MTDDKSLDILGVKPLAKTVEIVAGKSVDGLGAFLGALCMPAAQEFGLLLKDKVAGFRAGNLAKIAEKTAQKIKDRNLHVTGDASPQLMHQIIEDASWADDPTIQSMWAGLLAVASSSNAAADDSIVYTDILKRLTPYQARVINAIYSDPRCCSVEKASTNREIDRFTPKNALTYTTVDLLKLYPGDLAEIVPLADKTHQQILDEEVGHVIALSRFRPQLESLVPAGLVHQMHFNVAPETALRVFPSFKGLDLYMRCLGYSMYPLEAFLVTQQHWNQLRGIDPFTYSPHAAAAARP